MKRTFLYRLTMACGLLWMVLPESLAQTSSSTETRPTETATDEMLYGSIVEGQLGAMARVQQFQKLVDDKNYEINTAIRVPSINGGERVEREIREKAEKVDENRFKIERSVQNLGNDGRFRVVEVVSEDHLNRGNMQEITKSTFRPDLDGRLQARAVEKDTITSTSKTEKQIEKAVYRPDLDGKLSLSEMETGQERKVAENVTVKEVSRQVKGASGHMVNVSSVKETATKLGDSSFRKETTIQRADDNGRLGVSEKVTETQTENPDGTRQYLRVLESRNILTRPRDVDSRELILYQRTTGEERKLSDGTIESTFKVETLDPVNFSNGLQLSQMVTEVAKPLISGKVSVERIVKIRDVNGNFVVSQRSVQVVEPTR
jgi:hypothetical protein